jgi:transcriptional accessory protein Tex/SPT6
VTDATAALEGARAILVERFTEDAALIGTLREEVWLRGRVRSRVRAGKADSGAKYSDYFDFSEPLAKLPSHRILALFRGEKEEGLRYARLRHHAVVEDVDYRNGRARIGASDWSAPAPGQQVEWW